MVFCLLKSLLACCASRRSLRDNAFRGLTLEDFSRSVFGLFLRGVVGKGGKSPPFVALEIGEPPGI